MKNKLGVEGTVVMSLLGLKMIPALPFYAVYLGMNIFTKSSQPSDREFKSVKNKAIGNNVGSIKVESWMNVVSAR